MKAVEKFCGQKNGYSRSITLRNKLIPIGKTEENIRKLKLLDKDMEAAAYNGNNALTIALAISMGIIFVAVAGKFRTEFKKRLK